MPGEFDTPSREQEPLAQLERIVNFINAQLVGSEPWLDNDWGDELVTREREGFLRTTKNMCVFTHMREVVEGQEIAANELIKDHLQISIHSNSTIYTLRVNSDNTFDYSKHGRSEDSDGPEDVPLDEAAQDPLFVELLDDIGRLIDEAENDVQRDYDKYPLPINIAVRPLGETEQAAAEAKVRAPESVFEPVYAMSTDQDAWLASHIFFDGSRYFLLLYRYSRDEGIFTPYPVYSSGSQATWRLLPKVHENYNESGDWYDKGLGGEEVLNLPVELQKTLWRLQSEEKQSRRDRWDISNGYLHATLKQLTDVTYDVSLAGNKSTPLPVHSYLNQSTAANLIPHQSSDIKALFDFETPLYGQIEASLVASRDGSVDYLLLTQKSSGKRWVGMAQPRQAQMLESFILDTYVQAGPKVYAPLMEYGKEKGAGYEDNTAQLAGNMVLRALFNNN